MDAPLPLPPGTPLATPTDESALREVLVADDVPAVAEALLGCRLRAGQLECRIVETEAYHQHEAACHGYQGRTGRADKLRRPAGRSYVYLSYGIHHLVNVVTGPQSVASAVLIRGVELDVGGGAAPRGVPGPGRVGTLLAATLAEDDIDLLDDASRWQLLPALAPPTAAIKRGPRIGISKATELPWRYWLTGSAGVSPPR